MRILVTNDDGIHAPGLETLERIAKAISDDVWVVAPAEENSGAGHSLSLADPIRYRKLGEKRFEVAGTPTDCVVMAARKILPGMPDLVLSGLGRGERLHAAFVATSAGLSLTCHSGDVRISVGEQTLRVGEAVPVLPGQPIRELLTFEELRHEVRSSVGGAPVVVDAHHMRARDQGRGLRLSLEPLQRFLVLRVLLVQHLDGEAFGGDPRVARQVDAAHATPAEDAVEDIGPREGRPEQRIGLVVVGLAHGLQTGARPQLRRSLGPPASRWKTRPVRPAGSDLTP